MPYTKHYRRNALAVAVGIGLITSGVFVQDSVVAYANEVPTVQESTQVRSNVVYLDSLTPTTQKSGDRPNINWGYKNNKDHDGRPIVINFDGKPLNLEHGVSTHAPATIEYDLQGKDVNIFETYLALTAGKNGKIEYKIFVDGVLQYASGIIENNTSQFIRVKLNNASKLKIEVDHLGSTSYDHVVLGDAKVYKKEIDKNTEKLDVTDPGFSFENMNNAGYRLSKDQYMFIQDVGRIPLFTLATQDKASEDFVLQLLNNPQILRYYNTAGKPAGNNKRGFIKQLKRIFDADPEALTNPQNQKIAVAVALEYANGPVLFWPNANIKSDAVKRYEIYRDLSRQPNQLMPIFKTLDIELMRNVVSAEVGDQDLLWLREKIKREKPELLVSNAALSGATHQYIAYNTYNRFGDWVQVGGYYGYNPSMATVIDIGGVCGSISKFDTVVLRAFGVPASLIGQPGHAAVVYMRDDGSWDRANNIASWADSQGGTSTMIAEGSSGSNTTYNFLSTLARKNPENYELSKYYYFESKKATNEKERIALQEKALELTPEFVPVYRDIMSDMVKRKATPAEWYQISLRVLKAFRNFPKPMIDLLNISTPHFNKYQDFALKAQFAVEYINTVDGVTEGRARDVYDNTQLENGKPFSPDYKRYYTMYSNVLGFFNFDGPTANRLFTTRAGSEYSIDGGATWKAVLEDSPLIPLRETNLITEENGILIRLKGMTQGQKIKFTASPKPTHLIVNDAEDFIVGLSGKYEYSFDEGASWISGDITPNLEGNKTVHVRVKRAGTNLGSEPVRLEFTSSDQAPARILHKNMKVIGFSTQQNNSDQAAINAINGDTKDFWHTVWRGGDTTPFLTFEFDRAYTLNTFTYLPRQDEGVNGNVKSFKLLTSTDGSSWTEAYSGTFTYTNNHDKARKVVNLPSGITTRYVKFLVTEGVGKFASAADITFGIDQTVANQAKKDYENRLDEALKPQYITKLKELGIDVNNMKYIADSFENSHDDLKRRVDELASAVLTAQLLEDTQAMGVKLSDLATQYKALNDEVIWEHNKRLTAREPIDVSDKINEITQLDNTKATEFKKAYERVLALTTETVTQNEYNELMQAKYNLKHYSVHAQELLKTQADLIEALLNAIATKPEFNSVQKQAYLDAYNTTINADPGSITVQNYTVMAGKVAQAQAQLLSLPSNIQGELADAKAKLDALQNKLNSLNTQHNRVLLEGYLEAHKADFNGKTKTNPVWEDTVARVKAKLADTSQALSPEEYVNLLSSLETKNAELKYADWQSDDDLDRINKFKRDFEALLAKEPSALTAADKEALGKALDQFRRLNDYQQSQLSTERTKLLEMNTAMFAHQENKAQYANDWLAKLEVNLKTSAGSALGQDRTDLQALLERVKSTRSNASLTPEQKLQQYTEIEKERMQIVNRYAPVKEKARFESLKYDETMKINRAEVTENDETAVTKALENLNALSDQERVYLPDQVRHINELDARIKALKDPVQRATLEAEEQARTNALNELKKLTELNEYEQARFVSAIKGAIGTNEIQSKLQQAKAANTKKANANQTKQAEIKRIQDYIDTLVNAQNPAYTAWDETLTESVERVRTDYPLSYLEQHNTNELKYILKQIEKRVANLRLQNEALKKQHEIQEAQKEKIESFKSKLAQIKENLAQDIAYLPSQGSDAQEQEVKLNATGKDKLKNLVSDAEYAVQAGLTVQELDAYTTSFNERLAAILSANENIAKDEPSPDENPTNPVEPTDPTDTEEPGDPNTGDNTNNPGDNAETPDEGDAPKDSEAPGNPGDTNEPAVPGEPGDSDSGSQDDSDTENPPATDPSTPVQPSEPGHDGSGSENPDDDVCLIPEKSEHEKAVERAIERISQLENLTKEQLDGFIQELKESHAGCDLNEIINRAEREDSKALDAKLEAQAQHSVLIADAKDEISKLEHLSEDEKAEFANRLDALVVGQDPSELVQEAKDLNEKHKQDAQTPEVPTDPETPVQPGEPTEPTEPAKPEPTDPAEGSEPSNPGDTTNPVTPEEPGKPGNEGEPGKDNNETQPAPETPKDPEQPEPTTPETPEVPTDPSEPGDDNNPGKDKDDETTPTPEPGEPQPTDPAEGTEPEKPEPTDPGEGDKTADPKDPADPVGPKPTDPFDGSEPSDPINPGEPSVPIDPTPTDPEVPAEPETPTDPTRPSDPSDGSSHNTGSNSGSTTTSSGSSNAQPVTPQVTVIALAQGTDSSSPEEDESSSQADATTQDKTESTEQTEVVNSKNAEDTQDKKEAQTTAPSWIWPLAGSAGFLGLISYAIKRKKSNKQ